jgi:hypothetical protein
MGKSRISGEVTKKALGLLKSHGSLRSRELAELGISREMLRYLHKRGLVERAGRGLYRLGEQMEEHRTLLEASKLVPKGVICLLSALRFHEIGTQEPYDGWLSPTALGDRGSRACALKSFTLRGMPFPKGSRPASSQGERSAFIVPPRRLSIRSSSVTRSAWTWLSKRSKIAFGRARPPAMSFGVMPRFAVFRGL